MILVKLPNKGRWVDSKTAEEFIDTWGNITANKAIEQAQELISSQGDIGDVYEILEVTVVKRIIVKAERVGVIQ